MTERLYYFDSYQTEFDAQLVESTTINEQPAIVLDQTFFYPTSGGQPHDTGQLGGQNVVNVIADKEGRICHLLDSPLSEPVASQTLHGIIDWPRRHDHMQQHSGQHLLSHIFDSRFGYETVSVHFGDTYSTLDLDIAEIAQAQIDEAESYANEIVHKSLPISAYFVDDNGLSKLPLRRPPKVSGQIRIVEIDQLDYSACGGTHCHSTAELGPVKITRQERRRGQVRLTFLCGKRAIADYSQKHRLLNDAASLFSTEIGMVPELIERNLTQMKELRRQLNHLTERQLVYEAQELVANAFIVGEQRVVAHIFEDKDVNALKKMATLLQEQSDLIGLLGTVTETKLDVVFARGADVDLHMGNLLRTSLKEFGGGGGGRPDFAQGGGVSAEHRQALLEFAMGQI